MVDILFEDNHLLVVNKPAGMLVQGDATGDKPLAEICKEYIKKKYDKPGEVFLGVVHRLDRPVSGVVVLARTSKALERMNKQFREKKTLKTYFALTSHRPAAEQQTLIHWLVKDSLRNKTTAYTRDTPGAQLSELSYEVFFRGRGFWAIKVNPVTGRPHQIRVQLASIGCTILGDVKYGDSSPNSDGSIYLHARELKIIHPVKKEEIKFVAPFPDYGLWKEMPRLI